MTINIILVFPNLGHGQYAVTRHHTMRSSVPSLNFLIDSLSRYDCNCQGMTATEYSHFNQNLNVCMIYFQENTQFDIRKSAQLITTFNYNIKRYILMLSPKYN